MRQLADSDRRWLVPGTDGRHLVSLQIQPQVQASFARAIFI
jgi:hypothetical protein